MTNNRRGERAVRASRACLERRHTPFDDAVESRPSVCGVEYNKNDDQKTNNVVNMKTIHIIHVTKKPIQKDQTTTYNKEERADTLAVETRPSLKTISDKSRGMSITMGYKVNILNTITNPKLATTALKGVGE